MKEWEKELYSNQLKPAPPKMPPQEYIEKYLAEKDEKYFSWYLHYNEKYINEKVKGYVQEYAMQGHFMDMKSAYIFGLLQALHNYDPEKGSSFNFFQAYYTKEAIDDYIRTMRTGTRFQAAMNMRCSERQWLCMPNTTTKETMRQSTRLLSKSGGNRKRQER